MKQRTKKVFAWVMTFAMLLSLIPAAGMTASAVPEGTELTEAGGALTSGSYYLSRDITLTSDITIASSETITLDLNGYVLKGTGTGTVITNNGTLTITDSSTTNNTHYFKVSSTGLWELQSGTPDADYTFDSTDGLKTASDGKATTDIPAENKIIAVVGGCITGGGTKATIATNGGGVFNNTSGKLSLKGGNIVGNKTSEGLGGGVYVQESAGTFGTFEMTGGSVTGNYAGTGGGVQNYGSLIMSGGRIAYNTAGNGGTGGGVCNAKGTFTMTGGSISGNTAKPDGDGDSGTGGGVYNMDTFTMTGGSISGNKAKQGAGLYFLNGEVTLGGTAQIFGNTTGTAANNVYLSNVQLTISTEKPPTWTTPIGVTARGKKITTNGTATDVKYFTSDNDMYAVCFVTDHLELCQKTTYYVSKNGDNGNNGISVNTPVQTVAKALELAPQNAATIKLLSDIGENVTISEGKEITLDLNDCVLKAASDGSVIINNGTLTVKDSSTEGDSPTATIRYFTDSNSDGCFETLETSSYDPAEKTEGVDYIKVTGGCITGGSHGVENNSGSTLNLQGGNIIGNSAAATYKHGGGVYNYEATFTMNGGCITGNNAAFGGGVYNRCETDGKTAEVTMCGNAAITGNTATYGGGVYNSQSRGSANLTMIGGIINNNAATSGSGGVDQNGSMTVGGKAVVTGNTAAGKASNVCLNRNSGAKITLATDPALAEGACIGVSAESGNAQVTTTTEASQSSFAGYFHSDDTAQEISSNEVSPDYYIKLKFANAEWYYNNPSATEFTISNISELEALAAMVNLHSGTFEGKTIRLADNFVNKNASGDPAALTTPIGAFSKFEGTFDGNGKEVELNIAGSYSYAGLFGYVEGARTVKNVNTSGTISVISKFSGVCAGGVVGYLHSTGSYACVENCTSSCNIVVEAKDKTYVGGLVGYVHDGEILNSSFSGKVSGTATNNGGEAYVGGVLGYGRNRVSNCYVTGSVSGTANENGKVYAGGLIGATYNDTGSVERNCYVVGSIEGNGTTAFVGGVSGWQHSGPIWNCYYKSGIAQFGVGTTDGASAVEEEYSGCYALPETQMQAAAEEKEGSESGTWKDITLVLELESKELGKVSMTDALNKGHEDDYRYWGVMNKGVNNGYPVFALDGPIWLEDGKAYSGYDYGSKKEISMPTGITVTAASGTTPVTYTFNNVNLPSYYFGNHLKIVDETAKITLVGENQLGVKANTTQGSNTYAQYGIQAEGSLTITGSGTLTTYSKRAGIAAEDITFGSDFTGTINANDYGEDAACCLVAESGSITIPNGTFNLNNSETYAIHAEKVIIDGGTVNATGGLAGIYASVDTSISGDDTVVNATGGKDSSQEGAGIYGKEINISGGTVTATGKGELGIGIGYYQEDDPGNDPGTVNILGGTVTATGDTAGIVTENANFNFTNGVTSAKGGVAAVWGMTKLTIADTLEVTGAGAYAETESGGVPVFDKTVLSDSTIAIKNKDGTEDYVIIKPKTVTPSGGGGGGGSSTYQISVTSPVNGTAKADKTYATKGNTVTITVTPNEGYTVDAVSVKDASGNTIETTKTSDTTYTFTMPASKVTVSATFQAEKEETPTPVIEANNPFTDVKESDYFYEPVLWAVDKGITSGVTATTFCPYDITTRAQMVTFLWRAAGSPEPVTAVNPFVDVKEGDYFYKAVLWGYENVYVKGTSDTTFDPGLTVTRGQAVTFLARMAGVADEATGYTHSFTDVPADAYYNNSIAWASQKGIANGTGANTFAPDQGCKRGEVVTFLYRNANQ